MQPGPRTEHLGWLLAQLQRHPLPNASGLAKIPEKQEVLRLKSSLGIVFHILVNDTQYYPVNRKSLDNLNTI